MTSGETHVEHNLPKKSIKSDGPSHDDKKEESASKYNDDVRTFTTQENNHTEKKLMPPSPTHGTPVAPPLPVSQLQKMNTRSKADGQSQSTQKPTHVSAGGSLFEGQAKTPVYIPIQISFCAREMRV